MIHRTVKEWDYLPIESSSAGPKAFTRPFADRLLRVARCARLGGDDEERILVDRSSKLRAQQVVGVLVAKGVTLEILPKIEGADDDQATRRSLIHMLAKVLDLDIATGLTATLGWQKENLLEILIRLFTDKLFLALRQGMPRKYVGVEDDVMALRGSLDVVRQFTLLAATPQKLACRYDELSSNIALNQIMKAAIARLLAISTNVENQRRLAELSFVYDDVAAPQIRSLRWDQVLLDRTNVGWAELLRFAKMLLQDRYQSTTIGVAEGFSLLFEMNKLFEEFVGRALKDALRGTEFSVQLQGPKRYALIDRKNGALRFATRPDVVVSRNGKPLLVVDTKWKRLKGAIEDPKRGVGQADVYQMMAYAHVYDCDRLLLLYPHHRELTEEGGLVAAHLITNKLDSLIGIATVDLVKPETVGPALKRMLLNEGGVFNLTPDGSQRLQLLATASKLVAG
ncbi:restriction endonuclease [Bradyrhizobium sp. NAS96.2]|uniref:McrC family protein n=1 Tax=Bradyrhizobium sp. NAS96.2 TaxID=1680160 RepID=UPI00093D1961|nr:restriction endonuclease [Bradyrhizobium sp. NAS96.2]OKO71031.1 McrBC 5-methylcytosine restriction system component [Bradyrhizobium sp. NAS96.2]